MRPVGVEQEELRAILIGHVRGPPVVREVHRRQRGLPPGTRRVAGHRPQVEPLRLVGAGDVVHVLLGPHGPSGDPVHGRVHRRAGAGRPVELGREPDLVTLRSQRQAVVGAPADPLRQQRQQGTVQGGYVVKRQRRAGQAERLVEQAAGQIEISPQQAAAQVLRRYLAARRRQLLRVVAPVYGRQQLVHPLGVAVLASGHGADAVVRVVVVLRRAVGVREQRVVVDGLGPQPGVAGGRRAGGLVEYQLAVLRAGGIGAFAAHHPDPGELRRLGVAPGEVDPVPGRMSLRGEAGQLHGQPPPGPVITRFSPPWYAASEGITGISLAPSWISPDGATGGPVRSSARRNSVMLTNVTPGTSCICS